MGKDVFQRYYGTYKMINMYFNDFICISTILFFYVKIND